MKRLTVLVVAGWVAALAGSVGAQNDRVETPLAAGAAYVRLERPGPVVVNVLKAELTEPTLVPGVVAGGSRALALEALPEMARRATKQGVTVVGGLNGGHALLQGDAYIGSPIGLLIADGELICDPWPTPRSALLFPPEGHPRIESLGLTGTIASATDGKPQRLGGLNRRRLPGELLLYTPRFGSVTRVREAGRQVVLSGVFQPGDRLMAGREYAGHVAAAVDGLVNVEIPPDGVVLAGSGPSAAWLQERRLGEEVRFHFELTPDPGPLSSAVGAGPRLVRDGKISIEAEQEQVTIAETTGRQPRSAVGFNDVFLFLVAVDGRSAGYSVGMTVQELARLMVELGCTQAMELDGGGATTLFARDRVVNRPSDGEPRELPDAVMLFTSGQLSDVALPNPTVSGTGTVPGVITPAPVEPGPTTPVPPVTPGAEARLVLAPAEVNLEVGGIRQLMVSAQAADGSPVPVDLGEVTFQVDPAELGTVDGWGGFKALRAGQGRILARHQDQQASVVVRVSGGTTPPPTAPPPVEPTPNGGTTAPPTVPGEGTPTPPSHGTPGQQYEREAPAIPEGERKAIDGFESTLHWQLAVRPEGADANLSTADQPLRTGKACIKLRYDFTEGEGTRAVYALYNHPIGRPKAVSVWVYGDGGGHWLRGAFRDKTGQRHTVDFTRYINWDHFWSRCTAVIPPEIKGEIVWESIYLVQHRSEAKTAGAIYLDDFEGIY